MKAQKSSPTSSDFYISHRSPGVLRTKSHLTSSTTISLTDPHFCNQNAIQPSVLTAVAYSRLVDKRLADARL